MEMHLGNYRFTAPSLAWALLLSGCLTPGSMEQQGDAGAGGVTVSCSPSNQPCLSYKIRISDLTNTRGGISVLMQGDVYQGVTAQTNFYGPCTKTGGTLALCSLNSSVQATISSNCTSCRNKGDGRSVTATFRTRRLQNSISAGTLSKLEADSQCFESDENMQLYDGHVIDLDEMQPCRDSDERARDDSDRA